MKLKNGELKVPTINTPFGVAVDLAGRIPPDCDCVMVLINSGGGINAGLQQPVGFMKLTHQIYVSALEELIDRHERSRDTAQNAFSMMPALRWITLCPVRSKEHLNLRESAA